jgi:hypothetical protein
VTSNPSAKMARSAVINCRSRPVPLTKRKSLNLQSAPELADSDALEDIAQIGFWIDQRTNRKPSLLRVVNCPLPPYCNSRVWF